MGLTGLWAALQKQLVQFSPDSLMKTVTLICDLNVITNTKISNVKDETREVKTGVNTHTRHPLPLFNAYREKYSRLAFRALLTTPTSTPTQTLLLHPPTNTYLPRSTCKQSHSHCCCWLVQLGEGARFLKLARDFTSQHAQSACQLALPAFIRWDSEKIPLRGGLWCSLEQSIPKTSSVELPFSPGQSLPGRERSAGDRCHMRPLYPAAAFSTNSPSAKCDVKHPMIWEESSVSLLISFHC